MNRPTITDQSEIESLLTHTQQLLNHVYWFNHNLSFSPTKNHIGSSINYSDIKCRKDDFIKELVNTIVDWVYSKPKAKEILENRAAIAGGSLTNACAFLTTNAFSKFRPSKPQGQFGELILFNFLQHFFNAAPLLRKMPIMTTKGLERFGADAIHIKWDSGKYVFILGESKCYESKYGFKSAFENSLTSIINTFNLFDSELSLYTYDDFIEDSLIEIAQKYKNGELDNVRFELVCLITYNENKPIDGDTETELKTSIKNIIIDRCRNLPEETFSNIEHRILSRLNYVIFPVWELDKVLDEFSKLIGAQ